MSQIDEDHTRVDKLSDAQRECLRLVNQHLTSKEIAIRLGVSHHTINQRLERACKALGVSTRKEAARIFAVYDPIIYEPFGIADPPTDPPDFPDQEYRESTDAQPFDYKMRDAALPFVEADWASKHAFTVPFPHKRGDANALSIKTRLIWALLIASFGIIISGLLIAALETLGRIL